MSVASDRIFLNDMVHIDRYDFYVSYEYTEGCVNITEIKKELVFNECFDCDLCSEEKYANKNGNIQENMVVSPEEILKIKSIIEERISGKDIIAPNSYKDINEIIDRTDFSAKVDDHVMGVGRRRSGENEFTNQGLGPDLNIHTTSDYKKHMINTMVSEGTKCFIGRNGSDGGALFFYNQKTNTYIVIPHDKGSSPTMFRPVDLDKFEKKREKQKDEYGQLPEIKHGIYELLPNVGRVQSFPCDKKKCQYKTQDQIMRELFEKRFSDGNKTREAIERERERER